VTVDLFAQAPSLPAHPGFLNGGGECGALIARRDWSSTSVGPIDSWPQSLKTATSIMLRSPVPIVMLWNADGVMLYNDAYSVFAGRRHPDLLGSKVREGWPEVADFNDNVMKVVLGGGTLHYKDQELTLDRHGSPQPAWMDLDYSPVLGEDGEPAGVLAIVVETTDRVHADRRLKEDRERLAVMFEQAPGFMAMLRGPEHRFELANPAYERLIGRSNLTGKTALEVLPEVAAQGYIELLDRVFSSGQPFTSSASPIAIQMPDGSVSERFLDFVYQPITEAGQVVGIFVEGYDVTEAQRGAVERDRAQAALLRSEFELQQLADALPALVSYMAIDEAGEARYEFVNRFYESWFPQPRETLIGQRVRDVVGEEAFAGVAQHLERAKQGERLSFEQFMPYRDGSARYVAVDYVPRLNGAGRVEGVYALVHDITDIKRVERELRETSERVQLALDAGAIVGTWVWDVPGDSFTADERFAHSFGLPVEQCRDGLTLDQVMASIHPDDRERVAEQVGTAVERGGPYMCEYRVLHASGVYRWVEANGRAELAADGSALRFPGVLLDIEERRAVAAQRDRALELLRTFTEAVPGVVYAKDREGRLLIGNRGTSELLGMPPERYVGRTDSEVLEDRAQAAVVMANDRRIMESGVAEQVEEEIALADGSRAVWLSTKAPLRNGAGEVIGLIGSSVDITARRVAEEALEASRAELRRLNETLEQRVAAAMAEREQAQEALRQSQKLESMGQLTGGVAHDFNNLLTPIVGSLDMLQRRGIGGEREQRLIGGALQSAERAKTLVQRLLAFARRQPLQPAAIDVPSLVEGMADLIAATSGPQVKVVVDAEPGLPPANADPNQLEMALLNLGVNARDAMESGGTLRISVAQETVPAENRAGLREGGYILLSVADTGVGMDEATLARAVEPFFSTKGIGKGTGLGLSMVHGLALQLGGALTISSRRGVGTNVELWLPVSDRPVASLAARPANPAMAGAGRVLLVDDEEIVRASTADMLAELGYEVIEAASAEEALARIGAGPAPDLLITDHLMPGMTGTELVRRLREERPGLPALLISGYAEVEDLAPDLPRLAKPFRQADLAASIAAIAPGQG
jgi:PAS domain S-box-containing protein